MHFAFTSNTVSYFLNNKKCFAIIIHNKWEWGGCTQPKEIYRGDCIQNLFSDKKKNQRHFAETNEVKLCYSGLRWRKVITL